MQSFKDIINSITQQIVAGANPEKIILFGSFAAGNPRKDSDIDLFIIRDSLLRRDERDKEIRRLLKNIIYPMDIFIYTPNEYERLKDRPGSFVKKILATGKTLYERK